MFDKLVKTYNDRVELETIIKAKKQEFESSIINELNKLDELKQDEDKLRQEVYEILKNNNESSVQFDDKVISRNEKKTIKIDNPQMLYDSMELYKNKLEPLLGTNINLITSSVFRTMLEVVDKSKLLDIVDKFYKVEGKLLDGVVENITPFITIKNK